MFKIEIIETVHHTATISDDDESKIKKYISDNPDLFEYMSHKQKIITAIDNLFSECEIDIYADTVESESSTDEIRWSEFEERTAKEILDKTLVN